jgi:uncharacterized protein YciI
MLVMMVCMDKANHVDLRLKTRPDHLAWITGSGLPLMYAGPIMADDGETPAGSLIIAEFESLEAARAFQKTDPYSKVGLFDKVTIQPTRKVLPAA